jgi:hypothetical protein
VVSIETARRRHRKTPAVEVAVQSLTLDHRPVVSRGYGRARAAVVADAASIVIGRVG